MRRLGFILIVLSYAKWTVIPFVHLFPVSMAWKGAIYAGLVMGSEVIFWTGISIVGIESFKKICNLPSILSSLTGRKRSVNAAVQND